MKSKKMISLATICLIMFLAVGQCFGISANAQQLLYGDVNGDAKVNVFDYIMLKKYISGTITTFPAVSGLTAADVNGDIKVNVFDYLIMKKYITGAMTLPSGLYFDDNTPVTNRYYALDAKYYLASEESINVGFDGNGYINYDNVPDGYIEWTLNVEEEGNYRVNFRYANGTDVARQLKITANGITDYVKMGFKGTGSWMTWADNSIVLHLKKGQNTIKALVISADGGPNMNYLELVKTDDAATNKTSENLVIDGPYVVVSKDGSGNFKTIIDAYNYLTKSTSDSERKTIYVKNGVYKEQMTISKPFISIIGESKENTILTYNVANGDVKPSGGNYGSADCAALTVAANDFNAQNITFENSHLKDTGKDIQAACVYTYGDRLTFSNCNFYSGQDTLCAYTYGVDKSRVYFKECFIQGSVDFIWGGATALFDNCALNVMRDGGMYTAANTPNGQKFGYVFLNCTLTANADANYTVLTNPSWKTPSTVYLGRTYGDYCHVSYINCNLNAQMNSLGWLKMKNNVSNTALLEEYGCKGTGANRSGRVSWSKEITSKEASEYTISNVLSGKDGWMP